MTHFDCVVSLGCDCTTAFQIKRNCHSAYIPSAFDWLVTPFDALIRVFEDDGEQFCVDLQGSDGWNVFCERYGLWHVHDFPKSDEGRLRFSSSIIANARAKLIHKHRKMLSIARNSNPLFVRFRTFGGPEGDVASLGNFGDFESSQLTDVLQQKLGHDRFRILLIEPEGSSQSYHFFPNARLTNPRILVERLTMTPEIVSSGDWPEFGKILKAITSIS